MDNKHFFAPLLPDFHNQLTIPVSFFSKYIQGRSEKKTAKLTSDTSEITWKVKVEDGRKLTDGWKEFALAHDLRIGDILIFRQKKDRAFHVTLLGPSCCEIQYDLSLEDENNLEEIKRKKRVKKNPRREETESSSSLDPSCFVANVTAATLRYDILNLPRRFARANGLLTRRGEIVLMNEKGRSWPLGLKQKKSCRGDVTYLRGGWRSFCHANGIKAGDSFTFKLIQRGNTLVLRRLSPTESDEEEDCSSEGDEIESLSTESDSDEEESNKDRLVTLTLTPKSVRRSLMFLPVAFTGMHGITMETKMSLLDKHGVKWSAKLLSVGRRIKLARGWKDFFTANCVKMGESIMLELIWEEDKSCVLKFCSKVKQETRV